ncbi:hypothetical protein DL771_002458 [Monosporascus sp. 5C6A]|nr:hypothetical protein DL771_002458 [Monosporascus sp. 5C6A]
MAGKSIVFITGGNTGIGYETVKALLDSDRPYLVLMGSRSLDKAKSAIESLKREVPHTSSSVEAVQIDVASDESVVKALETVKASHDRIDVLINNAGGAYDYQIREGTLTTREAWNKTFDVNVTGAYLVTTSFMPLLLKSADPRLLFVTSGLSSLTRTSEKFYPIPNPPPAGWPKQMPLDHMCYRSTKTALNMLMLNLHFLLTNDSVKTWCVSPGFLATGLAGLGPEELKKRGAADASIGGIFIKDVVEGQRDTDTGKVVFNDGTVQPW